MRAWAADFHYYGMLQHQQNMLQDYVRTATYYAAIMENQADFAGKVVMDVGAGNGILSLFAAQVIMHASENTQDPPGAGCVSVSVSVQHCRICNGIN